MDTEWASLFIGVSFSLYEEEINTGAYYDYLLKNWDMSFIFDSVYFSRKARGIITFKDRHVVFFVFDWETSNQVFMQKVDISAVFEVMSYLLYLSVMATFICNQELRNICMICPMLRFQYFLWKEQWPKMWGPVLNSLISSGKSLHSL